MEVKSESKDILSRLHARCTNRPIHGLTIALAVIIGAAFVCVKHLQPTSDWTHVVPGRLTTAGWYFSAVLTVQAYIILRLVYVLVITFSEIRRVFRDTRSYGVNLKILHPDGVCGLSPITRLVFRVSLVIAALGLLDGAMIVVSIYRLGLEGTLQQIGQPIALLCYLAIAPAAFFLPLLPAHKSMLAQKRTLLGEIAHKYEEELAAVRRALSKANFDVALTQRLKALGDLYTQTQKTPVWPFDWATLGRFAITVVLPIATPILAMACDRLFAATLGS